MHCTLQCTATVLFCDICTISPVHDQVHLLSEAFEEIVELLSLPPAKVVVAFAETKVDLVEREITSSP